MVAVDTNVSSHGPACTSKRLTLCPGALPVRVTHDRTVIVETHTEGTKQIKRVERRDLKVKYYRGSEPEVEGTTSNEVRSNGEEGETTATDDTPSVPATTATTTQAPEVEPSSRTELATNHPPEQVEPSSATPPPSPAIAAVSGYRPLPPDLAPPPLHRIGTQSYRHKLRYSHNHATSQEPWLRCLRGL